MSGWRNGRRSRLKIYRSQDHEGSSPSPDTFERSENGWEAKCLHTLREGLERRRHISCSNKKCRAGRRALSVREDFTQNFCRNL